MSDAKALRIIADQMEDNKSYRTDEMGIEALCLRNAADRIEQLEAALDDMAQYVSRADWHYIKPETRAALGEKK